MLLHSYISVQALDCFSTHLACTKPNGKPWSCGTSLIEINISSSISDIYIDISSISDIYIDISSISAIYCNAGVKDYCSLFQSGLLPW